MKNEINTTSYNGKYGLLLNKNLLKDILLLCEKSKNCETGGILIGKYNTNLDLAIVSKITGPTKDSKMGSNWLFIGVNGLKKLLKNIWTKNREYYLGEWHFHPNSTPNPSDTDINQLKEISVTESYKCPEPILLIIAGEPPKNWTFRVFVCVNGKEVIELK